MGIPKPLVQTNQLFIITTVLVALLFHYSLLLLPFTVGVYTLATKKNPVILFSKRFLSKPSGQYRQEDRDQQLFNQWIATVSIGISLLFFTLQLDLLGFIFSCMVIIAAGVALIGFCIGCFIRFRYMMWKHRQEKNYN